MAKKEDIVITQGKTYMHEVRWQTTPIVYKPITGITRAAPCVVTAAAHGVPDGWPVAIVSASGMTQINARTPPKDHEYKTATVLTTNTIELNDVNSAAYTAYTSGGYVQYYTPHELAGYTALLVVKTKVGGTELLRLTSATSAIVIDDAKKCITVRIDAVITAAWTWTRGVYELELHSSSEEVTAILHGTISVTAEIATTT